MTLDEIRRYDESGMYEAIKRFPAQWREGRERALATDLNGLNGADLHQVLVAGMGGSAIGGDLLRTLALEQAAVPVLVSRSYDLPGWVGPETLVVVSSYSGNTEETLSALTQALDRGAMVACITSNGTVRERAASESLPVLDLPGGWPPRAALGYSLTALLTLAEHVGVFIADAADWAETNRVLGAMAEELGDVRGNDALDLATLLEGLLPLVYSSDGLLEAVNVRWRNQLHENAKTLAVGNVFPELNHNEISVWDREDSLYEKVAVVVLRDAGEHPQIRKRIDVTRRLMEPKVGRWMEVKSRGTSRLARVLSLIYLGDWVSFYLAVRHGVDPTAIPLIRRLKEAL